MDGPQTRFGLIGYGAWGRLHAQSIAEAGNAHLAAICCTNDATAEAAASEHPDTRICRSTAELLQIADIDVADIVVPNHMHAEVGIAALEAGKHVLLEKPMATSIEDCDRLLHAALRNDRVLSVGHELRLSAQWQQLKDLIHSGELGTPHYANFSLFRHPFRLGSRGWRHDPGRVGSWFLEETVHFFDLLLWYFAPWGDPVGVRALGIEMPGKPGLYANVSALLWFQDGLFVTVNQCLQGFEHHFVLEVAGDQGALRSWWSGTMDRTLEPAFELKVQRRGEEHCSVVPIARSGEVFELSEQIRCFAETVRERQPVVSGEEARKSVLVCLEAERSLREQRDISLDGRMRVA